MAKLKLADFYYGAVLSLLLDKNFRPALIERGKQRQIYEFSTNEGDFTLFVKYCFARRQSTRDESHSWTFNISGDREKLMKYLKDGKDLSLGLVCGAGDISKSEYVALGKDEIQKILDAEKTSFTISRKPGKHDFDVSMDGTAGGKIKVKAQKLF